MAQRSYAGAAKRTSITGDITATSTNITVADGTGYPTGVDGPFAVAFELGVAAEEKVLIASRSGNTLTVATGGRGFDGTTAADHRAGSTVDHVLTAIDIREANAHVNDTTGDPHPQYLNTTRGNAAYQPLDSRVWRPAADLTAVLGSPSFSVTQFPGWSLDAAVTEEVGGTSIIPAGWATFDIDLWWTNEGAGAGDVRFTASYLARADGGTIASGYASASVTAIAPAEKVLKVTRLASGLAVVAAGLLSLSVAREGSNAGDTLPNDARVIGFMLRKAT